MVPIILDTAQKAAPTVGIPGVFLIVAIIRHFIRTTKENNAYRKKKRECEAWQDEQIRYYNEGVDYWWCEQQYAAWYYGQQAYGGY